MFHPDSARVINLLTKFLDHFLKMGILETYALSSTSQFTISECQINSLLEQIKCLKIVLLGIKAHESYVDKKEALGAQTFLYSSVENEQNEVVDEHNANEVYDGVNSQINTTQPKEHTSQVSLNLNLELLEQENNERSKIDITTGNVKTITEVSPLLNTYTVTKVIKENTASNSSNKNIISSITVNVDECEESKSEEDKRNFNYSESLKTPNPDFGDKKLSDTASYIEVEPPTPLLYENISKDLAEPDCDEVKPVKFIKEIVGDNNVKEVTPTKFIHKTTGEVEILNKEKEPVNFIREIITEENKSSEDISKSEDFIRAMITGETRSRNPNTVVLAKADDFLQEILTSDDIKDKTKRKDYLRALITEDTQNIAERHVPDDVVQELTSKEKNSQEDTPKTEDFIKEIISGVSKNVIFKETEKGSKDNDEYDKSNEIDQENASNPRLGYHNLDEEHENTMRTQRKKNGSGIETEVENQDKEGRDTSLTPTTNKPEKTTKVKPNVDTAPSITFLTEMPNVTDATNNYMNQIIDNKPKTPSQLNFMDDLNSKQGCEKADDVKYDSESLKTPKPVIAEDSNYYTEEHGYSFTVLDTQYKPQSSCTLYEDNNKYEDDHTASFYDDHRRSSLCEVVEKPIKKSFVVESTQEHTGCNYSENTTGNHGNRTRPSVPIHIEQNKIYERETEKDMNTFTIPSLSFFNCDNLYDDESVLSKKPYALPGEYSAPIDYNESQRNEGNNQQGYFNNETYEHYDQSESYGQRENHEQNEIYRQNSNPVFYNKSCKTSDYYNRPYSNSYESNETSQYSGYGPHQYYEDTFPNHYQQDYQHYFSEETPQNYPACSYEHNNYRVFSAQNDFVSPGGYNMNFTDDPHPIGERGNESSQVLQDSATFPTYGQSDYTHVYNTQDAHSAYGYENYDSHTCAITHHEEMYQSSANHGDKDMYYHYDVTSSVNNVNRETHENEQILHSGENINQHNYQTHDQLSIKPLRENTYENQSESNSNGYLTQSYQTDQHRYDSRHDQEMPANLNLIQTGYQSKESEVNTSGVFMNPSYSTSTERLLDYNHLMCEETLKKIDKSKEFSDKSDETLPKLSSPNKENSSDSRELRNHIEESRSESSETGDLGKRSVQGGCFERHILEEQGESQSESQDLKFFETLKKFTQPPPAFDILSDSQQNSFKHTMSRLSKHSAKKRFPTELSSTLMSEADGENSTEQSALTYTQLRTPERENIQYTGDLKTLLACSYYTEELPSLQHLQKSKKPKSQLAISREHRIVQNEQDEKGFCCEFCGQMFMTKHSLKYHHTTLHKLHTEQAFVCHICTKPYHRKSVLIAHLQSHEGVKKFACEYCSARFSQKISCRVHTLRHRGEFKYECAMCSKKYATQAKLNFHVKSHEEASLTCVHCNKKFTTKQYLRQHLNIHQKISGGVTCGDCGALFKSHKARLSHKQRSHPIALHDCSHCSHSFTSSALLSKHVSRLHSTMRQKFPCTQCPKVFLSKAILLQHSQSNHNPDSTGKVKPYQCTLCSKKYSFHSKLSTHMKTHGQTPSIACPICGKLFYRKDVMKRHQTTHLARSVSQATS